FRVFRTVAAYSPAFIAPSGWPAGPLGAGRRGGGALRGVTRAGGGRRRRALALEPVLAGPAGARSRLAALGVPAAARRPAVAAAFFLPAHRLLRQFIA